MKKINLFIGTLLLLLMFGCAGPKMSIEQNYTYTPGDSFSFEVTDQANVTEEGMDIFKTRLGTKLNELGIGGSSPNKIVDITFTNYKMRHGASRALLGAFAGADTIATAVIIKEKGTGTVVGKLNVESKNVTAMGTAKGLIEDHADKIANYIKTGMVQ